MTDCDENWSTKQTLDGTKMNKMAIIRDWMANYAPTRWTRDADADLGHGDSFHMGLVLIDFYCRQQSDANNGTLRGWRRLAGFMKCHCSARDVA